MGPPQSHGIKEPNCFLVEAKKNGWWVTDNTTRKECSNRKQFFPSLETKKVADRNPRSLDNEIVETDWLLGIVAPADLSKIGTLHP